MEIIFVPSLNLSNTTDSKIIIDKESYLVIKEGEKIMLPRKEFELLAFLASTPKKVFFPQRNFRLHLEVFHPP